MSEATEDDPEFQSTDGPDPVVGPSKPRLLGILGPGLITGASDDDPSGIATYSQAGAQVGFALVVADAFHLPADGCDAGDQRTARPHDGTGLGRQHPPSLSALGGAELHRPAPDRQRDQPRSRSRLNG